MTLLEEVKQLYQYDPKDFEKTAPFVPASPFCKKEVHQHKDEAWGPHDNQLINQLKKAGLDAEVENIVKVLDEWRGPNLGKVWISDTLPADLNLPLTDEDHPAENTVQAFFIGKNLPSFVLTLFNLQNDEGGPDLEKHIHKHTVATLQELHESLLDFCHDRFAILGCTLDMQNFNSESLKRELELREEECEEFYDGPINLDAKVFNNMTKAAVLLQGNSCVTCYMPSSTKHIGTGEYQSILFDQTWRNVVHLLIEFLTHTEQTTQRICCKSALKLEVAILEAACRVGRSRLVTIKSSPNAEVNDCVRKMNNKENCKLRLEPSDEIGGSFRVISQQSTIIFTKNEGNATVTLIANQDFTPVEDGMIMTYVGNFTETDTGVATVTAVIEDSGWTEDVVRRDDHTEKKSIEEVETATRPASEEDTRTTRRKPETRDVIGIPFLYQAPKPCHSNACVIVGMPQTSFNESDEELREKVCNLFVDALDLPDTGRNILTVKRLGKINRKMWMTGQHREICVVFASKEDRDNVLKKRVILSCTVLWIEEYLPLQKYLLLLEARQSFGNEHAWSENGVVHVEMHDGYVVPIYSSDHLLHIFRANYDMYQAMLHNYNPFNQAAPGFPHGPQVRQHRLPRIHHQIKNDRRCQSNQLCPKRHPSPPWADSLA